MNQKDKADLKRIKEQMREVETSAINQNGLAVHSIKQQTPKICEDAIKQNKKACTKIKNFIEIK